MLQLMFISKDPELARIAVNGGVNRIFVDLEIFGKIERQGHLNTLISHHTLDDVRIMRESFPSIDLLVRINPYHDKTYQEIEDVMQFNPQMIMLPMYKTFEEVANVSKIIGGRAELIPLLETSEALSNVNEVSQIPGVSEVYLGLNDLHLALKLRFMFLLLADGTVERVAKIIKGNGKRFGFGGIARIEEGLLPAGYILAEHERLGSSSVILSRTFHRQFENLVQGDPNLSFYQEIKKLRDFEKKMSLRTEEERQNDKQRLLDITMGIINHV